MYKKAKKEITNLFEDGMSLFLFFCVFKREMLIWEAVLQNVNFQVQTEHLVCRMLRD